MTTWHMGPEAGARSVRTRARIAWWILGVEEGLSCEFWLDDLLTPAGNRLEALKGDQAGRHSIRVNDQYRITFRWESGHAFEVCGEDYH